MGVVEIQWNNIMVIIKPATKLVMQSIAYNMKSKCFCSFNLSSTLHVSIIFTNYNAVHTIATIIYAPRSNPAKNIVRILILDSSILSFNDIIFIYVIMVYKSYGDENVSKKRIRCDR